MISLNQYFSIFFYNESLNLEVLVLKEGKKGFWNMPKKRVDKFLVAGFKHARLLIFFQFAKFRKVKLTSLTSVTNMVKKFS